MAKCKECGYDLSADNIRDLIPLCHSCYVDKNPQVKQYLERLKEWNNA